MTQRSRSYLDARIRRALQTTDADNVAFDDWLDSCVLKDETSPVFNVESYGASPSASAATNTAAIQAAIDAANAAGGTVYFPPGTYTISGNIDNFWDVKHSGEGVVRRSGVDYNISPNYTQTNQLFVAASGGASTNTGLSVSEPFATIQQAIDVLKRYSGTVPGRWIINLAAGTYTEGAALPLYQSYQYPILLRGPDVSGGTPTAIIDGTGASNRDGLSFNGFKQATVRDIKIQDFTSDSFASGVYVANYSNVDFQNVHTTNCSIGVQCEKLSRITASTGDSGTWAGNSHAAKIINLSSFTIDGATLTSSSDSIALVQGMSNGHIDNSTIDSSTSLNGAVHIIVNSTVHLDTTTISNNRLGIKCDINSSYYDNSITFTSNTRDVLLAQGSFEREKITSLTDIPDLQFWLDASDETYILASDDVVSSVRDKSSNSYNLDIAGTGDDVLIGDDYILFQEGKYLSNSATAFSDLFSISEAFTLVFVYDAATSPSPSIQLLGTATGSSDRFSISHRDGSLRVSHYNGSTYSNVKSGSDSAPTGKKVGVFTWDGSSTSALSIGGVNQSGSDAPYSAGTVSVAVGARQGGATPFDGKLYHLAVYDRVLSAGEIADVIDLLS